MFNALKIHIKKFQAAHFMVVTLAIALQVQLTFFAEGDYLGLRVSLADMLVPFLGVLVLSSILTRKSVWPNWTMFSMVFWLAAIIIVMSASLLNGYIVNGFLSSWALVNKYIGFLILISYLLLGGWIVANTPNVRYVLSLFMVAFTSFYVFTVFISMLMLFAQHVVPYPLWLPNYPWDGFMANRNAFMVIYVITFIFIIWAYENKTMIPIWVRSLFWFCLPIFFVFNDSRTGWIVSIILFGMLFFKDPLMRARSVLPLLLMGIFVAYSSYYITTNKVVKEGRQMRYLVALTQQELTQQDSDLDYWGDQKRYVAVEDGLELYKQYDPLVGAGLGAYKPFQIEKRGEFIDVMDFTGLWLLVETGVVGFCIFVSFFLACAWSLYRIGYVEGHSSYHRAMLAFLIIFAAMSVLHELMYTRVLWLAMGLALGSSAINSEQINKSHDIRSS